MKLEKGDVVEIELRGYGFVIELLQNPQKKVTEVKVLGEMLDKRFEHGIIERTIIHLNNWKIIRKIPEKEAVAMLI